MKTVLALAQVVIKELYRRKDFYVVFVLTILIGVVMALAGLLKERETIVQDLKEVCLLLIWISSLLMAVGMTARQMPAERDSRTIFPLLAKPVTRAQVVVGKFLGCWLAMGIALLVFYFCLGLVSASQEHQWPVLLELQALWLQWVFLAIVIALVLLGSLLISAPSSNATLCLLLVVGVLLMGRYLGNIALEYREPLRSTIYSLYFLLPHLDWMDVRQEVVKNQGLIDWADFVLTTIYGGLYTAMFLFAAWLSFRRKALN